MKTNFMEANRYVEVTHTTPDNLLTIQTGWGVRNEALFRKGLLKLETEAAYARIYLKATTHDHYSKDDMIALAVTMLEEAQKVLVQKVPAELIDAAVARLAENATPIEAPKPVKVSKAQKEKDELSKKILSSTDGEKISLVNGYGVFNCYFQGDKLRIYTGKVLSITHYKKLKSWAGRYLEKIDFTIPRQHANQAIFELCLMSISTNKLGQDTLAQKKRDRLSGKTKRGSRPATAHKQSFKEWYDDADIPEKINGVWVDLETGIPYQG